MTLAAGTRFGAFEITGLVGAGGMGEVYRARDPQLGREVALKVLPDAMRLDPEAIGRFEREARLLASLNHPNVATLHGLATSGDDAQALVMELVEGRTLDELIASAPRGRGLPLDDALDIARQIAAALDAAHDGGVVHRDLKPANVKIRLDGTVKVLDFGIAKALSRDTSGRDAEAITHVAGALVGTPAYMSPEQATGAAVDRRTDIWAFGCVLYEMLTGQRPFDGDTDSRILARVIEREPDWSRLDADVPLQVRLLLRQCLEKDPRKRRRDAGDLRLELEQASAEPRFERTAPIGARDARTWGVGLAAVAASALVAAAAVYVRMLARETPPPEMRLEISTPPTLAPDQFALSPDARYIVFVASESSNSTEQRLYLRQLDSTEARPIAGTEGARLPFWSPDSRSIGFYASDVLNRIDIDGGRPQPLGPAPSGLGGAWSPNGTILFNPDTLTPLFAVPASGGKPVEITHLGPLHQKNHRHPFFLPDGRRFLFYAEGEPEDSGIYLGSLDGGSPKRLMATDSPAIFLPPDRVIFVQDGALLARRLDADHGALIGEPVTLASSVGSAGIGIAGFSSSSTGVVAYRASRSAQGSVTTWFDAAGNVLRTGAGTNGPALSPDDRFLAYDDTVDGNRDVWILDLDRGGITRFTTDPAVDGYPVWSPDGRQLVFESQRGGNFDLWIAPVNRVGQERLLVGTPDNEIPIDWSVDDFLLYRRSDADYGSSDLLAVPVSGKDRTPIVVAGSPFEERMGAFSPDGKWVAYDTNRSGRFEVVVQAFPEPNGEFPISTDGGLAPLWSKDGEEIYFISPNGAVMAARVNTRDSSFAAEKPVALFRGRVNRQTFNQQYAVTKDRRFVVNSLAADDTPTPITVLLNWKP